MWKEDIRVLSSVEQSKPVSESGYSWQVIEYEIQHARSLRGEALAKIINNIMGKIKVIVLNGSFGLRYVFLPFVALARFPKAVMHWSENRQVYGELSAMDDRILADIGVTRSEIEAIAFYGKVRKPYVHKPINVGTLRRDDVSSVASNQEVAHRAA